MFALAGSENPRQLRLAGTSARVLVGAALIAWSASDGLTTWDAIGGVLLLPALAFGVERLLSRIVARLSDSSGRLASPAARVWALHGPALVLILAIGTALTFVTPIDAPAIWLFLGASLLIAAIRGDAGCEALAIPNAILGRREETGCIAFAVIDRIEASSSRKARRGGASTRLD